MALEVALSECNIDENLIKERMALREKSYMACFSKKNPKDLSSNILWKYYADNNKGVVIKFDYTKFPYRCSGSHSSIALDDMKDISLPTLSEMTRDRDTEFRMFPMNYYKDKFIKNMNSNVVVLPVSQIDSYKPEFCSVEEEIRLIVFLREIKDVDTLRWEIGVNDIRRITAKEYNSDKRPTSLDYDILSIEGKDSAIEKIFCKDKSTYCKLQKIFKDENMYQLL